jgi:hypothetical protein
MHGVMSNPSFMLHGLTGLRRGAHSDRRRTPRAWVSFPMDARFDNVPHACQVVDLSATGMMFVLGNGLLHRELDMLVRCDVQVSDGACLPLVARAVWRRGELQGARFVALAAGTERSLLEILSASAPLSGSDVERLDIAEAIDLCRHGAA